MTKRVKIAPGKTNVLLPNGGTYQAGDEVDLSDEQFEQIGVSALGDEVLDITPDAGGGGDPFPLQTEGPLAGFRAYTFENDGTILIATEDQLTGFVLGAAACAIQSVGNQVRLLSGTAEVLLDPSDNTVSIISDNLTFFGGTPAPKPTGVAVTAEAIHAALVSLGLIAGP